MGKIQFKKFCLVSIFLNCQIKLKIIFLSIYQASGLGKLSALYRGHLGEQNLWGLPDFSLDLQISSQYDRIMKMLNLKCYCEHEHTYNVLVKFTSVMTSKSNYLHCVKSVSIWSYSVRMQENADQNNSKYGHLLRNFAHGLWII